MSIKIRTHILPIACLFLLPGNLFAGELADLRTEIESLKGQVERRKVSTEKLKNDLIGIRDQYESRKARQDAYQQLSSEVQAAVSKAKALEFSIKKKQAALKGYDKNFVPLSREQGTVYDSLKFGAKQYQNVSVTQVLNDSIRIKHSNGFAAIPAVELPEEFRAKFVFRPSVEDLTKLPSGIFNRRPAVMKK